MAPVLERALERAVRARSLIGDECFATLQFRTERQECAKRTERTALDARGDFIRQRFAHPDVHHAESAEVAVFGAEGATDDIHFLNEFRAETFQGSEVSLAVSLGRLVLLYVVHQNFESAVHAAVIEVESEAPDLHRLAASFMLSGVDSGIEDVKDLVVAREASTAEDF